MTPVPSEATATMSLPQDENTSLVQQGVKSKELHSGTVTLLDGRRLTFQVSKNADGEVLFNLITDAVGLIEKDYFSLAFYDNTPVRKWLYKNKKIQKQVKDLPWDFSLEVKFYTPDPSQLADDFTRHLLTLQLRADIYNGRLPASLVNQAHLGSLIAQAELGDYSPDMDYKDALTKLNIVPQLSEELEAKTIQLYKDQKGKTPPEAEMGFLMTCRELTLYGMVMFSARHNGKPVRIGINSAGISVFQEHLRQNYIVWQGMHQLEYQRKTFTLKLKHGEKEGKSSLTFKLDAEPLAKLCWRTSVEHHTFFRLMQPEDKPNKSGFFQLGSGRFRPEGRTHFQTKMASQMFDGTPTAGPQISSAQVVSRSSENLPSTHQGSSPLHFADDKEGNSPQKRYTLISSQFDETTSPQVSTMERSGTEVGTASDSGIENAKSLDSPLFVSTTTEITAKTTMITRSGRYTVTETPSPRFLRPQENVPHPEQPETWPDENVRAGRPVVSTPTFLSAKWFSRQRRIPPLGSRTSHDPARRNSPPTPTRTSISVPPKFGLHSEKRELHTESARYTTKTPARSLSAIPYAQLIATSPSGDQLLPIVREVNESVLTTLMSLPSRSHTVLAEYISSPDNSQLSTELISNYRALLAASGHTPEQVEYRVREASTSRVYCRRSHLSPKTPYSKLPANAEEAIRTRTPSPNVNFDDSINHCIRIVGIDNTVPLYRYNISAAEAQRAIRRSAKSPDNRKEYQSLTREDNITETPKSRFAFAKKKRHVPRRKLFERDEFTPILHQNLENEMQTVPIRYYSNIYHSGIYSEHHKIVERKQHSGEESEGDASNTDYSFDGQQYIDSERLEKSQDLEPVNLRQCVKKINYPKQKYRGPSRFPKPVAVLHLQRIRRPSHGHKNGFAQVDLSPIPRAEVQPLPEYPVNNVPYTGHLDTLYPNKLFTSPLRENVDVYHSGLSEPSRNRRFKFFTWARHEGEEEVGDQDPAGYKFDHTPYEGPLDETSKFNEIQTEPLASHVTKYHGGESVVKGDEEEVHEEPHDKQTAIIHLRTKEEEPQVEELKQAKAPKQPKEKKPKKEKKDKDQESSFFGIFKHKDRKPQEEGHASTPSTSSYPLVGERYEGPLEEVGKENELDSQPLRTDVNVYHSGLSEPSRNRRFKFFTWARHEGEEEVGDQDPAGYKFDHTPYEGPLDETSKFNEIQTEPLASYVKKYHEGYKKDDAKKGHLGVEVKITERASGSEEESGKRTAVIHLKDITNTGDEHVKKAHNKSKTARDRDYKLFGLFKGRTNTEDSQSAFKNYPSMSYDGPVDQLIPRKDMATTDINEFASLYHRGQYSPRSYRKGLAILHLRKLEERRTASDDLDGRPKETVKSVFGRKRKRQDRGWLQSIVRARRGDHSELSAGYVCNDQSIFNQGKMVNDLNVDVFLKREMQSSYEVEVLFRDTKTSRFEPLFNRRGPVFLPKSLLDETNENVELKLREIGNKRSGRGAEAGATALNGAGPLGAQDDSDEADESSLASQPVTSNGAGTKRFRHRRAEPTDQAKKRKMAANKSAKEGTRVSLFSSLRRQISQFSSKDKKSKKSSKQDSASSSDSDSEIEVEERHIAQNDKETAPPHSTLQSWHESEISPEHVVTETDEHGNVIKKTIKTSHETHTIQKQSYQTFALGDSTNETSGVNSIENALETIKSSSKSTFPTAATHAQTRVLVYGKDGEQEPTDITYEEDQVVQSKVVTTGNRTIETITYKTVKDGVVSTNVEHRVTIQGPEVDHEAELRKAIIEATGLNPRYEVQRVEVKQERLA